jgi:rhamnogalacturonyl hydrolase YesR
VRTAEDPFFADAAERITDALVDAAREADGGLYVPYTYDFALHGNEDLTMTAPWYSGMAQGLLLSSFTRLHRWTGAERYRDLADRTFRSLVPARDGSRPDPWVSHLADGHYWIEEYPVDPPPHTLNGKLFAIYGLYEYWRATGGDDAERLLRAALTTVDDRIAAYRVPGDLSYYCLGHRAQIEKYHAIHVGQLGKLYRMTGHDPFRRMAAQFRADHAPEG